MWAESVFVTSLGLWTGAALFFSAAVLPILFTNFAPSEAGHIAALLFPAYFAASLVLGIVATAAAFALIPAGDRVWQAAFALLVVMTLAQAWTTLVVYPQMGRIRGDESQVEKFQQLHRISVRLNGVVLAGSFVLLCGSALLLARRHDRA